MTDWPQVLFNNRAHPTQVAVMEAFDWIEEPFSPVQFTAMGGPGMEVSRVAYHMRALAKIGSSEL